MAASDGPTCHPHRAPENDEAILVYSKALVGAVTTHYDTHDVMYGKLCDALHASEYPSLIRPFCRH